MDSVHGLSYPDSLLDVLPVLDAAGDPIRALSATQFAEFHLQHTLAHPPDNVLFPFLHGLEGDNHAQNTFFAPASSSASAQGHGGSFHHSRPSKITPRIPKYRGLVWVVCEDDLEKAGDGITLRVLRRKPLYEGVNDHLRLTPPSTSSSDDESDASSFEDDDDMEGEEYEEDERLLMMMRDDSASPDSLTLVSNGVSFGVITDLAIHPNANGDLEHTQVIDSNFPSSVSKQMDVDVRAGKETDASLSSSGGGDGEGISTSKDNLHYEGRHMHPLSHRAPPVRSTPATPPYPHPQFQHPGHPTHGLGINITIPSSHPPSSYTSASSSPASTSTSTSTPCSSGSTPNSSIFSPDQPCPDSSVSSPTTASLQDNNSSLCEDDNCPSTPCANAPLLLDLEQSPPRSTRSFPSFKSSRHKKVCLDPSKPPLLSSTFRPKELIRRVRSSSKNGIDQAKLGQVHGLVTHPFCPPSGVIQDETKNEQKKSSAVKDKEEGSWEFVPAKVPEGISLRNFGIQVPIYATLSDIIIYSPYGVTPATLAVARRFRDSINAKRIERMRNAGVDVELLNEPDDVDDDADQAYTGLEEPLQTPSSPSASTSTSEGDATKHLPVYVGAHTQISIPAASKADLKTKAREAASGFVQYRVFVLDANEEEMREKMPHLMMRIYGDGEGSCGTGGMTPFAITGDESGQKDTNDRGKQNIIIGAERHLTSSSLAAEPGHGFLAADPGAHTDGPDGHILELGIVEAEDERRRKESLGKRGVGMDVDMVDGMDFEADAGAGMEVDPLPLQSRTQEIARRREEEKEDLDASLRLIPNTVDFALREKEEMRDLTKASAIISLSPESTVMTRASSSAHLAGYEQSSRSNVLPNSTLPLFGSKELVISEDDITSPSVVVPASLSSSRFDPRVGEVYLGNSGDVPLAPPDVPSRFGHPTCVPGDIVDRQPGVKWDLGTLTAHLQAVEGLGKIYDIDEEREGEEGVDLQIESIPHDGPFDYLATNDPAKGFGFDICIECHDLAPFPTAAHMRAAEEHLGVLDVMWRERWQAAWYAKEERRVKKTQATLTSDDASPAPTRMNPPPPAPPRPPPHANAVIHLPFPSSPPNSQATMVALIPLLRFLEKWTSPLPPPPKTRPNAPPEQKNSIPNVNLDLKRSTASGSRSGHANNASGGTSSGGGTGARRWSSVSALLPSFPSFASVGGGTSKDQRPQEQVAGVGSNATHSPPSRPPSLPLPHPSSRTRSLTSPPIQYPPTQMYLPPTPLQSRTRPLKILLYSSDGYTESSVPALCLLMSIKGLGLPEAYLELQIEKRRSFFVYQSDLGLLKRVDGRLREDRDRDRERERERGRERLAASGAYANGLSNGVNINANGKRTAPTPTPASPSRTGGVHWAGSGATRQLPGNSCSYMGRPAAKSISFANHPPPSSLMLSQLPRVSESLPAPIPHAPAFSAHSSDLDRMQQQLGKPGPLVKGRPRANTSPWLPSLFRGDHQSWFNDPRFDGSFPSRVLPFLYLGNLNHASNVYMLHALGITHVVSVGECALVPPPHHMTPHLSGMGLCHLSGAGPHYIPGKGPSGHGSLWIEEREGRIKVMDIKGVCDDGIDTLEPQLEPICDWIDKARQEGGQVLVHCRVGVSRSATVTIAYVMKHLNLPLVDAYLIVRSRRLSVLIQPNMRLLYNLCGWEIKLAKESARGDPRKLKKELARTLTWPYLAKEVHALNEKYLH